MGSRYGGLKQMDGLGPNGEAILDYSVYDALRAGFGKIVFVIRKDFEDDFRRVVLSKYEGKVQCELCFQSVDKVPEGCTYNPERTKPWGTNHAVLMGKDLIKEPFAVINADDFYGKESYQVLADFLHSVEGKQGEYCMVGYRVCNTLSENGSVARGICDVSADGTLKGVTEMTKLVKAGDMAENQENPDAPVKVPLDARVSMNCWGFTPKLFTELEDRFVKFLAARGTEMKSEWYIPFVVDELIKEGKADCKVLPTDSRWFGVTYREDKPFVVAEIQKLVDAGEYPANLF